DFNLISSKSQSRKELRCSIAPDTNADRSIQHSGHELLDILSELIVCCTAIELMLASHSYDCHRHLQPPDYTCESPQCWSESRAKSIRQWNDKVVKRFVDPRRMLSRRLSPVSLIPVRSD